MPLLDKLREQYGVGPLCSELHIAPSTYYHCQQQRHHPDTYAEALSGNQSKPCSKLTPVFEADTTRC